MQSYLTSEAFGKIKQIDCRHPVGLVDDDPQPNGDVPPELDWDLWLGPTRWLPFNPKYLEGMFRGILECGGGALANPGVQLFTEIFRFTGLESKGTLSIEAEGSAPMLGLWDAPVEMKVKFAFTDPNWILTWNQPGEPVAIEKKKQENSQEVEPAKKEETDAPDSSSKNPPASKDNGMPKPVEDEAVKRAAEEAQRKAEEAAKQAAAQKNGGGEKKGIFGSFRRHLPRPIGHGSAVGRCAGDARRRKSQK